MNNKKITVVVAAFMLLSHEMRASTRNFLIGTLIVAYIHENVITKQDLTKLPEVSVNDVQEYNNKLVLTVSNTYESLKKISSDVQAYFTTKFPDTIKKDGAQENKPLIDLKDQLEKRHN